MARRFCFVIMTAKFFYSLMALNVKVNGKSENLYAGVQSYEKYKNV
jgi:hypothetical protein